MLLGDATTSAATTTQPPRGRLFLLPLNLHTPTAEPGHVRQLIEWATSEKQQLFRAGDRVLLATAIIHSTGEKYLDFLGNYLIKLAEMLSGERWAPALSRDDARVHHRTAAALDAFAGLLRSRGVETVEVRVDEVKGATAATFKQWLVGVARDLRPDAVLMYRRRSKAGAADPSTTDVFSDFVASLSTGEHSQNPALIVVPVD